MPSNLIVIPLAFQIIAIIFLPSGVALSPACSQQPFNNPNCGILFNQPVSVAFTASGYSYNIAADNQQCQSIKIDGVAITQVPVLGTLVQLPILNNIANFFLGIGQYIHNNIEQILTNPTAPNISTITSTVQACVAASTTSLLTFSYTGDDIILLFISAVFVAAGVAAISSVVINAGASLVIFTTASLGLIYLILTALAYPTWSTIPSPFGAMAYSLLTLSFALGIVGEIGSIAA